MKVFGFDVSWVEMYVPVMIAVSGNSFSVVLIVSDELVMESETIVPSIVAVAVSRISGDIWLLLFSFCFIIGFPLKNFFVV